MRRNPFVDWLSQRIRMAERSRDWEMAVGNYERAERLDEDLRAYRLLIRMEGVV